MASKPNYQDLSKRERQIMNILHKIGEGSVSEVLEQLPDPPKAGYSSIRAIMGILRKKGFLAYRKVGAKYVYYPTTKLDKAQKSALNQVMKTFFEGSAPKVVSTLLGMSPEKLSEDELDEIA